MFALIVDQVRVHWQGLVVARPVCLVSTRREERHAMSAQLVCQATEDLGAVLFVQQVDIILQS